MATLLVVWLAGGHASALPWRWGAEGEQWSAREIAKLGDGWQAEHDIPHAWGNWDHVLVGPAGVFLLDTKTLHRAAEVRDDALRSGRIVYRGATVRGAAREIHDLLADRFGRPPGCRPWSSSGRSSLTTGSRSVMSYTSGARSCATFLRSRPAALAPGRVEEVAAAIRGHAVATSGP